MNRSEILERVRTRREPWNIVVIGGGATGVGCALDAASRGYDVLLLEQSDFGKGTSSRSTKLIHGGVRYLAQGNISLVREALKERGILLNNAPHVVHKLAFIVPCYTLWQKIFYATGLKIYDLLAGKYSFGRSRVLSKTETLEHLPTIRSDGLRCGILYYDGQFDDTRLLIDMVSMGHEHGAAILNYAKVTSLDKGADGKICGLTFDDVETGESFSVSANSVINATGAFCDSLRSMADPRSKPIVTHSRGIHLVLDRKFLPSDDALMIPKTSDGRVLFCIPWLGAMLVGTTDTPIDHAEMEPAALDAEIDFVLENASRYLADRPKRSDILSVFAGIRPLVNSGSTKDTASLLRGYTIEIDGSGLLTITGGKWTTYRRMAEAAVDQAVNLANLEARKSLTASLKIRGAEMNIELGERLVPDLPYHESNILLAVRNEMAVNLEDVLARRTRVLFVNARAAIEIAPNVAKIMASEMGKDDTWVRRQIDEFNRTVSSYLAR